MKQLSAADVSRIIEMAWEDRTPFEAIRATYYLTEEDVKKLMQTWLKPSSYRLWRKRVVSRKTKHQKLRHPEVTRAYSSSQYKNK